MISHYYLISQEVNNPTFVALPSFLEPSSGVKQKMHPETKIKKKKNISIQVRVVMNE